MSELFYIGPGENVIQRGGCYPGGISSISFDMEILSEVSVFIKVSVTSINPVRQLSLVNY